MRDVGLLLLRLTVGGLLAGHGAQKLFGWFGGPGVRGTKGMMESIGLRPGQQWGTLAGVAEFGGGLLTALGLGWPVGPIAAIGPMVMATGTVHWGKPIWVTNGGAELPVTNMAVAAGLALYGPGRFSLDRLFGLRIPGLVAVLILAATGIGVMQGLSSREPAPAQPQQGAAPEPRAADAEQQPSAPEAEERPRAA